MFWLASISNRVTSCLERIYEPVNKEFYIMKIRAYTSSTFPIAPNRLPTNKERLSYLLYLASESWSPKLHSYINKDELLAAVKALGSSCGSGSGSFKAYQRQVATKLLLNKLLFGTANFHEIYNAFNSEDLVPRCGLDFSISSNQDQHNDILISFKFKGEVTWDKFSGKLEDVVYFYNFLKRIRTEATDKKNIFNLRLYDTSKIYHKYGHQFCFHLIESAKKNDFIAGVMSFNSILIPFTQHEIDQLTLNLRLLIGSLGFLETSLEIQNIFRLVETNCLSPATFSDLYACLSIVEESPCTVSIILPDGRARNCGNRPWSYNEDSGKFLIGAYFDIKNLTPSIEQKQEHIPGVRTVYNNATRREEMQRIIIKIKLGTKTIYKKYRNDESGYRFFDNVSRLQPSSKNENSLDSYKQNGYDINSLLKVGFDSEGVYVWDNEVQVIGEGCYLWSQSESKFGVYEARLVRGYVKPVKELAVKLSAIKAYICWVNVNSDSLPLPEKNISSLPCPF